MGTKSIRHIVESVVATYLSTQTGLTTVTFLTGDSAATQDPAEGRGSLRLRPSPWRPPRRAGQLLLLPFASPCSPTRTTPPSPDHRARCAALSGNMRDLTSIQAAFVAGGDATCYDVTIGSEDEGIDERSWATAFSFGRDGRPACRVTFQTLHNQMAAIETGTTCIYGVAGTVTNLFVQSYSLSASFNAEATVADETGITKTARYDDRKTEITIDGIAKTSTMPVLGAAITFTVNTASSYPGGAASTTFRWHHHQG
jgi:hypothetical protein